MDRARINGTRAESAWQCPGCSGRARAGARTLKEGRDRPWKGQHRSGTIAAVAAAERAVPEPQPARAESPTLEKLENSIVHPDSLAPPS